MPTDKEIEAAAKILRYARTIKGAVPDEELAESVLEAAEKVRNEWQLIETAPKEFEIEVLACEAPKKTKAGHAFEPSIYVAQTIEDRWNGRVFAKKNGNICFPTHWAPLLQPPKEDK